MHAIPVAAADSAAQSASSETVLPPPRYSDPASPQLERSVSLLTANTTRRKSLLVVVDHRNREPIGDAPFHDLLGFDGGGLKIGLGLRYGILDNLDAGLYRLNGTVESFDVYDLDLRYRFLAQDRHGVDLAIRPGISIFTQKDAGDAARGFLQLLASRTLKSRFRFGSGLLYHSESTNDTKTNLDDDYSVAAQALFEVLITPSLAWNVEMSANLSGYGSSNPQISSSLKILTYRHSFAIVLTNNQYTSADGVVTNTHRGFEDIVIGFSITREIPLGKQW